MNPASMPDLKSMTLPELSGLAGEIRSFLVESISRTGGHLASNLGVVELTLALHRVFDTSKDRLVFDVGHQSYVHKLLTGRGPSFDTLRQFGGLSGFPKPAESPHDAFIAGHASAAVSEALGMARARTLLAEDYAVIALLGDGAMTGGLAYEALCDAGASKEPLIVILNDNGMSISGNVGGMARYLSSLRLRRGYRKFKVGYRRLAQRIPGGKVVYNITHRIKDGLKRALYNCDMFEDLGFTYVGPVDGHDLGALIRALEVARDMQCPALVHVITQKGKGYAPAEEDPERFHGIGPFDPTSGETEPTAPSFATVFGEHLTGMAEVNQSLIAVTAAMCPGTGLSPFKRKFPERFFDVGIAEEHAAAMCAGAAHQGLVPVFAVYSTFLQRAYDMLLHDIGIGGEHVVLAVDKCGISGEDGETHQGLFDVAYLRTVPGMTVLSPASFAELRDMVTYAILTATGPVAVRYPKGGEGAFREGGARLSSLLREGEDFSLITYGTNINDALTAADLLAEEGIHIDVLKLGFLKPWDTEAVERSARKTGRVMILEETVSHGCLGEGIAAHLNAQGLSPRRLILRNLGDRYIPQGSIPALRKQYRLDAESLAEEIRACLPRRTRIERSEADGEGTD